MTLAEEFIAKYVVYGVDDVERMGGAYFSLMEPNFDFHEKSSNGTVYHPYSIEADGGSIYVLVFTDGSFVSENGSITMCGAGSELVSILVAHAQESVSMLRHAESLDRELRTLLR